MKVYLVRRYYDGMGDDPYGTDDNYYLVGIYTTRQQAKKVVKTLQEKERPSDPIIEVEIDHTYSNETAPWLGGAFYIE